MNQPLPRGRQELARIDGELRAAATNLNCVLLDYRPGDGEETRLYKVEPYSYRNHGATFFGFDVVDKKIKAFAVLKIVRVQQTDAKFTPRWPVELSIDHQQSS